MNALVLSYFDNILGPRVFLKAPESASDSDLEMLPSLMDLNENGFFVHITDKFKSVNLIFNIFSEYARGKKENLLISMVTDINNEINLKLSRELLEAFAKQVKNVKKGYKAFYSNTSRYEFDAEKLQEIKQIFYTFYNSFEPSINALKDAELRYKTLFDRARDAIIIINYKTEEIMDMNHEAEKILGLDRYEVRGLKPSILHFDEDYENVKRKIIDMARRGDAPPIETRIKNARGEAIPVEYNASRVKIGDERLVQVIFRDITERKLAEQEMKKKESQLFNENKRLSALYGISKLAENMHLSLPEIFEITLKLVQGAFNFPEKAGIKLIYKGNEYKTNNFIEGQQLITSTIKVNNDALQLQASYPLSKKFSDEENYILYDISNRLKQILIIRETALERERIKKKILDCKKRYQMILENSSDGIWIVNTKGIVIFMNSTMLKKLGYEKKDVIGKSFFNLLQDGNKKSIQNTLNSLKKKTKNHHDFLLKSKEGKTFPVHVESYFLLDKSGEYDNIMVFFFKK
ncbi:MAG: PAS domain-containing protein [Promethearchaeota archaeon]